MLKSYPFPEKRGMHVFYTLLMLALLLLSRDTLLSRNLLGFGKSQVLTVGIIGLILLIFLAANRKHLKEILKDLRLPAAGAAAVCILLPMILKRDWQFTYVSIVIYIFICIFLSYFLTIRQASRYYLLILTALGAYSVLCTYGLRLLPDRGLLNVPVFTNSQGVEFYNFGLAQVSLEFVKTRNFGIFREPGVYQFFLLLGLYLNNYRADWEKNWQIWVINGILAFTMLTTFATGGIIEMGLLAVFLFVDKKWYRSKTARILTAALLAVLGCAVAWILITKNSLYMDLVFMVIKFAHPEYAGSHFEPIAVDLQIILNHPILGDTVYNVLHALPSNATSTMVMYAFLGLIGGSFHVICWAALSWDRDRGILGNLFLLLILFMSFNTQNFSTNLIFWLFPVLALCERGLPLLEKKKKNGRKGE